MIGQTVDGRYQIVRLLGEGGMGSVYEARHTGTSRRVAVKVINTAEVGRSASLIARLSREARAAGAIESKHIAQVMDTGVDAKTGAPYLVMEYLSGEDVSQLLHRLGRLPPVLALKIAAQSCIGLQRAHEAGIVHRDIKPANLFLARDDTGEIIVKLLDFGIAKAMMDRTDTGTEPHQLTRTGAVLGSPLYMSPEQARGIKTIDHRTDLWSLGIVLYRALTGQTPNDDIDALGDLIIAICSEPPPPVRDLAPWISEDVETIVTRALCLQPGDRYPTASAMLDAIRTVIPDGFVIRDELLISQDDAPREVTGREKTSASAVSADEESAGSVTQYDVSRSGQQGGRPTSPSLASSKAGSTIVSGEHRAPAQRISANAAPPPAFTASAETPAPGAKESKTVERTALDAAGDAPIGSTGSPRASRAPLAIAGAIACVAVAVSVYMGLHQTPSPAPSSNTLTIAGSAAASAPPAAAQIPTASASPAAAGVHRVKLVVVPSTASVEIDGAATPARDGLVDLSGPLGTTFKVRVFAGSDERIEDVAITEGGALPPKIELTLKHTGAAPIAPPKVVPSAATPKQTPLDLRQER